MHRIDRHPGRRDGLGKVFGLFAITAQALKLGQVCLGQVRLSGLQEKLALILQRAQMVGVDIQRDELVPAILAIRPYAAGMIGARAQQ